MLSIEDPSSDPSCSSSKASDLVGVHEARNFSIRDYVFTSRSKDIGINWPFSKQLLQLCVDNGIRDLLPPFEPSSLVRAHCLIKQEESEQIPKCSENKPLSENGGPEIDASSVASRDLIEGISGKQSEKRCRLAVKLCARTETSRPEDLASSLTAVADPMASKICPVCKSFTSSSNTTLNAHIDRCLSSDQSNAAMDVTECLKPKAKPRKKRLMVDIYTTAPYCTLEELDRRNGTNWATDLSLVAPANDTNIETERTKISVLDTVSRGNVGDIYVDSNGTKLLILSEFNDLPPSMSRKNFKLQKNGKGFKASRTGSLIGKKKSLKSKDSKFMKDNPQNKKLRVAKRFKDKIEAASEGDNIAEAHKKKEESISQLLSAQDQVQNSEPSTLGHWVCSKRSDLSRKLDGKNICKRSEIMVRQPDPGNSSIERSHALNISRSSEAVPSPPKAKRVNFFSNTKKLMVSTKKISLDQPSNLNFKSLPEGDSLGAARMANISSHNECCHPSLKARKSSTLEKSILSKRTFVSLEARKVVKSDKLVTPKKFQKHRSISGCSKWRGGEKHGSTEDLDLISSRAKEVNENHQSDFSENQEKGISGMTDQMRSTVIVATTSDNELDLDPSPEEMEESICRNESQLESPSERSTHDQEAQYCGDAIGNEIFSQDLQLAGEPEPILHHGHFQADTASIQEPHPCFTSFGESDLENNQEKSSTTSARLTSNQDQNMIVDTESSGSPVSTISAICSPSLHDDKLKDSEADQLAKLNPVHDKMSSRIKVKLPQPSCSCSQSLSLESQFTNNTGKKMPSDLFVKMSALSSFQAGPSLESPTESVISMASSKSAVNISNPILRLMGKDLVVNKEKPVQIPEILPCDSDYFSKAKFISFGIPDHSGLNYNNYFHYPIQSASNYQIPLQPHQMRSDKINSSQFSINEMAASHQNWPKPADSSYLARDVIVVNDDSHDLGSEPRRNLSYLAQTIPSSNLMASQRLFSSGSFVFPSPSSLYFSPAKR